MSDIVLDYEIFDTCVHILSEVSDFVRNMAHVTTSSDTYILHLCLKNAIGSMPCSVVAIELEKIMIQHGWDMAASQFKSPIQETNQIADDIEALADRLLAN